MKELEDHTWFPQKLRNYQTDFIGFAVKRFGIYKPFIDFLKTENLPYKQAIDLCSGSGQPAMDIFEKSDLFMHLTLTDKYPNEKDLFSKEIMYFSQPYDVLNTAFEEGKTYFMFNAFHHFQADDKELIINKIINAKSDAYLVEILKPGLMHFIQVFLMSTLGVFLLTPFIRPFSIQRILFTYILPLNMISILTDGIISVFKSKTSKQYRNSFVDIKQTHASLKVFEMGLWYAPLTVITIKQK